MSSVLEALQGAFGGGQDVLFLNDVLRVSGARFISEPGQPPVPASALPRSDACARVQTLPLPAHAASQQYREIRKVYHYTYVSGVANQTCSGFIATPGRVSSGSRPALCHDAAGVRCSSSANPKRELA